MSGVDLSLLFQKFPIWRIQMVASFLMRMCWFLFLNSEMMTHKNSNFILWEHTSSAMKLIWGKASQVRSRKEIWVRNVRHFSRTSHVLGTTFTNDCRDLDAISGFDSKSLTSCLPGNCWFLVCWLEEEWFLSAMFLHQRFGKYLALSWYRAEKNYENACGIKIVFFSDVLNIFSEIHEDTFFFLICANAQFSNKRGVTLCTKHGSGKQENQFQSFPLFCQRLLGIAGSLTNIFTSSWTTDKWVALPVVHSHGCMSPVAVPRFPSVCRAIYGVSSARGAAPSSNDLVIFNPGTSSRWLTMWLHTCLCWHNCWDSTGTGTSNRRWGKAAKTKFIEICPQFFLVQH